jgi:hypothetical protein
MCLSLLRPRTASAIMPTMTKPDSNQDETGLGPGQQTGQPDMAWLPLADAARHLGLSQDTTRKRLERDQLVGEKRGGRWFVGLAESDKTRQPDKTKPDETGPKIGQPDSKPDDQRALIDHLAAENAWLRVQLEERNREVDARSRELAAERERADTLHRLSLLRIEALTAGAVVQDAGDEIGPESPVSAQDALSGAIGAKPSDELNAEPASEHGTRFGRWWNAVRGRA